MKVFNISTAEKIAKMKRVLVLLCTWAYVSAFPLKSFMFVGLDGFGGFYIKNFTGMSSMNIEKWNPPDNLPNIQLLLNGGYYSFEQRNQLPAVSAPNWSTLITGLPPRIQASMIMIGVYPTRNLTVSQLKDCPRSQAQEKHRQLCGV